MKTARTTNNWKKEFEKNLWALRNGQNLVTRIIDDIEELLEIQKQESNPQQ